MTRTYWIAVGVAALAIAGGIAVGYGLASPASEKGEPLTPIEPPSTAKVEVGELTATISLAGTLDYRAQPDGAPYSLINQSQGTYTQLPQVGQVIQQGQVLYRTDDIPVLLLYGSIPSFRTLSAGATGADVAELNEDLVALGYAAAFQLGPTPASFTSATSNALEKFQAARGLPQTGTLPLGQALFEPSAMRVTALSAQLGGVADSGQMVMQTTSTARQVRLSIGASQQPEVTVGDHVTVTLPNEVTTPGIVTSVGSVATCPPTSAAGGPGTPSASTGKDTCSTTSSANSAPTITVIVTPSNPAVTGIWDQAPVQVAITTSRVSDATTVPVTALLAQSNGGYAVEVVESGGTNRLVPVTLGLFDDADGLVQVTDSQLAAGQRVVIPNI